MDNVVKERLNWLRHQIDYYGRYHDHKETMAWVATAFYLVGIMYLGFKVNSMCLPIWQHALFGLFVLFAGYLILCFVNWQFQRRWDAHKIVLDHTVELQAMFCPEKSLIKPNISKILETKYDNCWRVFTYILMPCKWHRKAKRAYDDIEFAPLISEGITYIAIVITTIVSILLVVLPTMDR